MKRWICIVWVLCALAARAEELFKVDVGYVPNSALGEAVVIVGEGWDKEAGLKFVLTRFSGPPTLTQAFAAGQMDVFYPPMGPALAMASRGIEFKAVAGTCHNNICLIARPPFSTLMKENKPKIALEKFLKQTGHKARLATNPKGSSSEIIMHYWLEHEGCADLTEVISAGSDDQFQQFTLSKDIDGATTFEPICTIAMQKDPALTIVVEPKNLMPDSPGVVMAVRKTFWEKNPEVVRKLVALQMRTTRLIHEHPEIVAKHFHNYFSAGAVSVEIYENALRRRAGTYEADPALYMNSARTLQDYLRKNGYMQGTVNVEEMFDLKTYNSIEAEFKK